MTSSSAHVSGVPARAMSGLQMRVASRDRALSDVLDLSFRFIASHASLHAKVALIVIAPAYALCVWLGVNVSWTVAWGAAIALASVAQAPFTMLASKLVFSESASARDAIFSALRALPRLILARFFQGLVVGMSIIMCIAPFFFVGPMILFLPEVVLLEAVGFGRGAERAWRLAYNQSGDAFAAWLLLLSSALASVVVLGDVIGRLLLENLFEVTPPESIFSTGGSYLSMLGFWIFVPLAATARFFIYLNLRTKIEGWDIQARFLALVLRAREGA